MRSHLSTLILILLSIVGTIAAAQSSTNNQASDQQTQIRGYWVDPSTGLMWPANDSGKDMTWHQPEKYCRNVRLAGYSDWRLPTLDELATLVDKSARAPRRVGNSEVVTLGRTVRGNLSLTGDPWSSNRQKDIFGHPYGPGWFFNFVTAKPSYDLPYFRNTKYALCVRH